MDIALILSETFDFQPYMVYVWLGLFVIMVIVEFATSELVSAWFAGGALLALIVSLIPGTPFWSEIIVFSVSSLLLLLAIRPLAKKKLMKKKENIQFNVDGMIGQKAVVTQKITELEPGLIKLHDVEWTAETADKKTIKKETIVKIVDIIDNKVKVEVINEEEK